MYCWHLCCCWFWRVHSLRCGPVLCQWSRVVFVLCGGQLVSCRICGLHDLQRRHICGGWISVVRLVSGRILLGRWSHQLLVLSVGNLCSHRVLGVHYLFCGQLRGERLWLVFHVSGGLVLVGGQRLVHFVRQRLVNSGRIRVLYNLFGWHIRGQWSCHLCALCFRLVLQWRCCGLHVVFGRHIVACPR